MTLSGNIESRLSKPRDSERALTPGRKVDPVDAPNPRFRAHAHEEDWAHWIRATAAGDQAALARLYDATNRLIYGLILRILGNPQTAEEVLLDVYLQIWKKGETYDAGKGSVLAWMFTIARSRAIDALRSRTSREAGKHEPIETADAVVDRSPSPEESSAISQRRRQVQRCLADLPRAQREAIELAYFRGLSHSEIAAALGQPLGTIKTRVRLGMQRLREALRSFE